MPRKRKTVSGWLPDRSAGNFGFRSGTIRLLSADSAEDKAMTLRELVDKYLAVAGGYGKPAALASLGLSREEIERTFGQFDEDYNISRYFHFQCAAGANYAINGFPQTHVSIDAEIQSVL
jgi:hypothetical protein